MTSTTITGRIAPGLTLCGALAILGVYVFNGAGAVATDVIPNVNVASAVVIAVSIALMLPLSLFRSTRKIAFFGFLSASYVLGLTVWTYGLVITNTMLGSAATAIGLLLGLVGVVPLGMIAAGWKGVWFFVIELAVGLLLTGAAYSASRCLARKLARAADVAGPRVA